MYGPPAFRISAFSAQFQQTVALGVNFRLFRVRQFPVVRAFRDLVCQVIDIDLYNEPRISDKKMVASKLDCG